MTKARASKKKISPAVQDLLELIVALETVSEAELLLRDLLTPQEFGSLVERWQEIQLLAEGKPQRDIAKKLGISISKVTRGSIALQYGTGGFRTMLKKLRKKCILDPI